MMLRKYRFVIEINSEDDVYKDEVYQSLEYGYSIGEVSVSDVDKHGEQIIEIITGMKHYQWNRLKDSEKDNILKKIKRNSVIDSII
jgi:hypothetical protein